jgi:hypothetical protein
VITFDYIFGILCGCVISKRYSFEYTLFIFGEVQHPVEIIGYADDWVIHTSDQDIDIAQANIQAVNVTPWNIRKGFKILPEKTVAMHICRKRIHNHRESEIRLNGHRLEIKKHPQKTWTNI